MNQPRECLIILVRHGETEANLRRHFAESDDIPLTETGRLQSHELALRLSREFHPQILVSSTFLRARQTSDIIGNVLGLSTEVITGIHERDYGFLKGQPYERMDQGPVDIESLDDVRRRAIDAIEALRLRHAGREIVVVCHGAVIQALCEVSVPPNCGIVTIASGHWESIAAPRQ